MSFCVDQCAKLDNKLLKASEIQFLGLSFFKQLDIEIPDKIGDFIFIGQEEELKIFEELYEFHHAQCFIPLLIILEVIV
jgi:hypothetical protein